MKYEQYLWKWYILEWLKWFCNYFYFYALKKLNRRKWLYYKSFQYVLHCEICLHTFKFENVQNPHGLFKGYYCSYVLTLRYVPMEFN
jgi:hypothetical protein